MIKTAILSFGMSGRVFHAPFISLHNGFELKGILERTKQESLAFYPSIHIYRSLEEVLNDDEIELVVINTPTNTHFDFVKKALLAGKNVVVEKAFTTTLEEAIELKALADSKQLMLSVYQNRRWDSDFSTVRHIIKSGVLGDIIEAEFHYDRFKPTLSPKLHKEIPGPGAGLLNDLGPHLIDQAISVFGMPQQVFADIRILRPTSLVDDYFHLILFYENWRVILKSSLMVREPLPSFVVQGKKGTFIKTRADVQEEALLANEKPNLDIWGKEPDSAMGYLYKEVDGELTIEKIISLQGNYYYYYDGIYEAITNKSLPPVTSQDGINVMKIINASRESMLTKKAIQL
jgi:predicted dehydrogenase